MKYWLDTEFMEDGRNIDLMSIGIVAEDGREFYCEFDVDFNYANDWVKQNVIPHLKREPIYSREVARKLIIDFCSEKPLIRGKPEFWGWYSSYDWVAFCQLFGRMVDLPEGWPKYCRDIKQYCDSLMNPSLPKQETTKHNALEDARWNKQAWQYLRLF